MNTRTKSTMTGLAVSAAAIMLSYAFGSAPSATRSLPPAPQAEMVIITLGDQGNSGNDADEQGQANRRHMSRVLATPYLSVGRLLPRRGS